MRPGGKYLIHKHNKDIVIKPRESGDRYAEVKSGMCHESEGPPLPSSCKAVLRRGCW
jgi:hypothetical protein